MKGEAARREKRRFFDYWTERPAAPLSAALKLEGEITDLRFERQFPTGLEVNPPNLDVVLELDSRKLVAIG